MLHCMSQFARSSLDRIGLGGRPRARIRTSADYDDERHSLTSNVSHIGLRKLACALLQAVDHSGGAQPGLVDRLRTSICLNMNSVNTSFFSGDCLRCATSAGLAAARSPVRANASLSSSWLHRPFRCTAAACRTAAVANRKPQQLAFCEEPSRTILK
jgi:hypothetical protein